MGSGIATTTDSRCGAFKNRLPTCSAAYENFWGRDARNAGPFLTSVKPGDNLVQSTSSMSPGFRLGNIEDFEVARIFLI
jgi:hypothetical protein